MSSTCTRYNSLLDWSTWLFVGFVEAVCLFPTLFDDDTTMRAVILGIAALFLIFMVVMFKGTYFEIRDSNLIIYEFFRPSIIPIDKIDSITPIKTILACSATSIVNRLAIKLSDRKVLKSSMPLIISPMHQKNFINQLLEKNPNIVATFPAKNKDY